MLGFPDTLPLLGGALIYAGITWVFRVVHAFLLAGADVRFGII
jgi:hypothetical protein